MRTLTAMIEKLPPNHSEHLPLAQVEGSGTVYRCDRGCFHVAFGEVTLNFRDEIGFLRLAARLRAHQRGLSDVELRYGAVLLRLSPQEFDGLVELVSRATVRWHRLADRYQRPAA